MDTSPVWQEREIDLLDLQEGLLAILSSNPWFMQVLRTARACDLPDWYVGAGVIRTLVWDALHGFQQPTAPSDVDLAFFDPCDLSRARDRAAQRILMNLMPEAPWEATNQAAVHLWYADLFGQEVSALSSTTEAIATWPETATCVAVKLLPDDHLQVVAPFGLDDLMGLRLKRNPTRVPVEEYHRRIKAKRIRERWPQVTIFGEHAWSTDT